MNELLLHITLFGSTITVTWWKIIGYFGVFCFGGRWVVQVIASYKTKNPTFPLLFWLMSLFGSILLLSYFIFGKNDSVGVMSNLFPAAVSSYNLVLHLKQRNRRLR
ncbi:lipid-A-disaccharide synthase N-terminal domain-containing protein [Desulfogranum japonicum]|uniref:lipid-A-disaccharide synthase N-terminal domain-containing protein n=1 Tax=Desulfogranum japonicum TaxID=231447 RepID=UPI0004157F92|nr:lipid-A-disaccharide synthase N-terminal domain-containing protein [Desulfogranum japonicum]